VGDAEGEAPAGGWTTVLWSSFGKAFDRDVVSIRERLQESVDDRGIIRW
jgi:hypothetical protein